MKSSQTPAELIVGKLLEMVEERGKPTPIVLIDGRAGSGRVAVARYSLSSAILARLRRNRASKV